MHLPVHLVKNYQNAKESPQIKEQGKQESQIENDSLVIKHSWEPSTSKNNQKDKETQSPWHAFSLSRQQWVNIYLENLGLTEKINFSIFCLIIYYVVMDSHKS